MDIIPIKEQINIGKCSSGNKTPHGLHEGGLLTSSYITTSCRDILTTQCAVIATRLARGLLKGLTAAWPGGGTRLSRASAKHGHPQPLQLVTLPAGHTSSISRRTYCCSSPLQLPLPAMSCKSCAACWCCTLSSSMLACRHNTGPAPATPSGWLGSTGGCDAGFGALRRLVARAFPWLVPCPAQRTTATPWFSQPARQEIQLATYSHAHFYASHHACPC